jgi:hypothetical protein
VCLELRGDKIKSSGREVLLHEFTVLAAHHLDLSTVLFGVWHHGWFVLTPEPHLIIGGSRLSEGHADMEMVGKTV